MMSGEQLWSENNVLREKLKELQEKLDQEHLLRLKLQAENLWIKKWLRGEFAEGPPLPDKLPALTRSSAAPPQTSIPPRFRGKSGTGSEAAS